MHAANSGPCTINSTTTSRIYLHQQ
jgi:hypothetical protein